MTSASSSTVRAAIYARVSSEQQAQQQTIESQVADLRQRVTDDKLTIEEDLCFLDDGVSGATLQRPALERLRDMAYMGGFQRLYIHSPDRLARRYAYQVLLIDELQEHGVEVVFFNHSIGASPEEDMLLQMQGMFAEYERAKIMERSRRGRRHAAHRGSVNVLSAAPYGYRYISKQEGDGEAAYEIVAEQAAATIADKHCVQRLCGLWQDAQRCTTSATSAAARPTQNTPHPLLAIQDQTGRTDLHSGSRGRLGSVV